MNTNERYALAGSQGAPSPESLIQVNERTAKDTARKTGYRFVTLVLITIMLALSTGNRAALSVAGSDMAKELGGPLGTNGLSLLCLQLGVRDVSHPLRMAH